MIMDIIIKIKKDVRRSPNLVQNEHEHLICAFDSRLLSASAPTSRSNHLSGANNENLTEIKKLFNKKIKQWQKAKSLSLSDFMLFISLELRLRASKKNDEHFSYYVALFDNSNSYTLRISDHHFDAQTDVYHKATKTTALTFSEKETEKWDYFKPDDNTQAIEYVYYESKIGKDELIAIAHDVVSFLETGVFTPTIPPTETHYSPNDLSGTDEFDEEVRKYNKLIDEAINSEFYKSLIRRYGKFYTDAKIDIEERCKKNALCSAEKPFPKDWKRAIRLELPYLVDDGDIVGRYFYPTNINSKFFVEKDFLRFCVMNGELRYYHCDEQGEPDEIHEQDFVYDPHFTIRQYIVNGKTYYYKTFPLEKFHRTDPHNFNIYYIKPRTTAPTNSRLRLLRIQAQAKIKLQQQRMR